MQQTLTLADRPSAGVVGFPLSPEQAARFVANWLASEGRPRDLVEPEAVLALARHSDGSLQRVGTLAEAALTLAEEEGVPRVGDRHVEAAASVAEGMAAGQGARPVLEEAGSDAVDAEPLSAGPAPADVPPSAPHWRRAAGWAATAAAAVLLAAGVGWAASEWLLAREQRARVADHRRPAVTAHADTGSAAVGDPVRPQAAVQPQAPVEAQGRPMPPRADAGTSPGVAPPPVAAPVAAAPPIVAPPGPRPSVAALPAAPSPAAPPNPPVVTADAGLPAPPAADGPVLFRGVVTNETMGQSGQMSLVVTRRGPSGAVTAQFRAWGGLIGEGELSGRLSPDGHLSLSGQLMMGRNPFDCELNGHMAGERLLGGATFSRTGGSYSARSSFTLDRS